MRTLCERNALLEQAEVTNLLDFSNTLQRSVCPSGRDAAGWREAPGEGPPSPGLVFRPQLGHGGPLGAPTMPDIITRDIVLDDVAPPVERRDSGEMRGRVPRGTARPRGLKRTMFGAAPRGG